MSGAKYQIRQTEVAGIGLFAICDIQSGQIIESVSEDQFITIDILDDFYEFMELLCDGSICNSVLFAYFLASMHVIGLQCKQELIHIVHYLSGLPHQTHGLIMWQSRELVKIENKQLLQRVISKNQRIQEQYQKIQKEVLRKWEAPIEKGEYRLFTQYSQVTKVTRELTRKYYSILESRGVYYACSRQASECLGALVPVIDKVNHSCQPNCKVELGTRYAIKSLKRIHAGQELRVCYGKFNEEVFFESYGFLSNWTECQSPNSPVYRERITQFYNESQKLSKVTVNYPHKTLSQLQQNEKVL